MNYRTSSSITTGLIVTLAFVTLIKLLVVAVVAWGVIMLAGRVIRM
jgi:hypothetical protein